MLWQSLKAMRDQQVPESSLFDVITSGGDSGATVTSSQHTLLEDVTLTLTSPQHALAPRKSVPDMDAILSELSGTPDCGTTFMSSVLASSEDDDMSYWDMDARDQFVRYEDYAENLLKVKEEPKWEQVKVEPQWEQVMEPEPVSPNTAYSNAVLEKISGVRAMLDLPSNIYTWTAEHTITWARWTLDQYKVPVIYADTFYLDGTSIAMLSKMDMVCRSAEAGEYLYEEMDIWKYASKLCMMSSSSDQTTFTDMKPVNTSNACGVAAITFSDSLRGTGMTPSGLHCLNSLCFDDTNDSGLDSRFKDSGSMPKPSVMSSSLTTPMTKKQAWSSSPASSFDSMSSSDSDAYMESDMAVQAKFRPNGSRQAIHLWQFLKELLLHPQSYQSCIRWLDRSKGIFKIEDSVRVARLWGARKNRPAMNYDKLSRSIRQYYKKGIIKKTTSSKRLVYQFCPPYV